MFLGSFNYREVIVKPTIVAAAYGSGDVIGTNNPIKVTNVSAQDERPTRLVRVTVVDHAQQNAILNLWFFDKKPTASTFTDNGALAIHDTDAPNFIGQINIAAGVAFASVSLQTLRVDPPLAFKTKGGSIKSLWVVVSSGGTPTYAAAADLEIKLMFEQD